MGLGVVMRIFRTTAVQFKCILDASGVAIVAVRFDAGQFCHAAKFEQTSARLPGLLVDRTQHNPKFGLVELESVEICVPIRFGENNEGGGGSRLAIC